MSFCRYLAQRLIKSSGLVALGSRVRNHVDTLVQPGKTIIPPHSRFGCLFILFFIIKNYDQTHMHQILITN